MANLMRLHHMPSLLRLFNRIDRRTTSCGPKVCEPRPKPVEKKLPTGNWVSYGFNYEDCLEDYNVHNASFFFTVTLCLIFGGFAWAYAPDTCLRDWVQREAFLELRRREKGGLPPIDPNYIPVRKMKLPAAKELCDLGFDITI